MASTYSWKSTSGAWTNAANWTDVTLGSDPAAAAPAAGETAQFDGFGAAATIDGPGTAALATLSGSWILAGAFQFGTLQVDGGVGTGFELAAGAMLAAGTAVLNGRVQLAAGASLVAASLDLSQFGALTTLAVQDGAVMLAGAAALGDAQIVVASAGRLEFGLLRDALEGLLTVDRAVRVTGHGFGLVAAIANQGTIATDGAASIQGEVSGAGVLEVDAGGTLRLLGSTGADQEIRLLGAGATLDLSGGATVAGRVVGLQAEAAIILPGEVDGVSYVAAPAGGVQEGRLDLTAGGVAVETLDLHGAYGGHSFNLAPGAGGVVLTNDAPAARVLQWNGGNGAWPTAGNWTDATSGPLPALAAPGGNDTVQVTSTAGDTTISGPGEAATIVAYGNVALDGTFTAGAVSFLPYNWAGDSVARLPAGAMVRADQVTVASNLDLSGASLEAIGTLALAADGPPGSQSGPVTIGQITLANHSSVTVGQLDLGGYFGLSTILLGGLTIDATSALEVGNAGGAALGALSVDAGRSVVVGADIAADVVNDGSIVTQGFLFVFPRISGDVSGTGTISLSSPLFSFGGGASFAGAVGTGQTVAFGGPNQKLGLLAPERFAATIDRFTRDDTIALPPAITSASFAPGDAGGVLSLFASGNQAGSLVFSGAEFASASFTIALVDGEAILSTDVPCFAAGSRIATPDGLVAVETLRPGDHVVTACGGRQEVRWLGQRRLDCRLHPRPHDVLPVCIRAGAFAVDVPLRDLRLSPDHAVFSDGALIPVRYLLNGATIVQEDASVVTYFHVELERHDVLLAEGLACESYLDTGNRAAFANGGGAVALHPDFGRQAWDKLACGRLEISGPAVMQLRTRLFGRALALGHRLTPDAALHLSVGGRPLLPRRAGDWHLFRLPASIGTARMRSRAVVPAHAHAGHDDHRHLGVAIPRLRLDGADLALDDPRLGAGWHPAEQGWRWTDGAAEIDLRGARRLAVAAPTLLDYWCEPAFSPVARSECRRSRP